MGKKQRHPNSHICSEEGDTYKCSKEEDSYFTYGTQILKSQCPIIFNI